MALFNRATGPECPACGCLDSEDLGTRKGWRSRITRRRCTNCLREFTESIRAEAENSVAEVVTFSPTKCPACGSGTTTIRSTRKAKKGQTGTVRYHKCSACGHRFKSAEDTS